MKAAVVWGRPPTISTKKDHERAIATARKLIDQFPKPEGKRAAWLVARIHRSR
jgi:hypothetical protein